MPLPRNLPDVVPLFEHHRRMPKLKKTVFLQPPKLKRVEAPVLGREHVNLEPPALLREEVEHPALGPPDLLREEPLRVELRDLLQPLDMVDIPPLRQSN